jgi:hypothetical protein
MVSFRFSALRTKIAQSTQAGYDKVLMESRWITLVLETADSDGCHRQTDFLVNAAGFDYNYKM